MGFYNYNIIIAPFKYSIFQWKIQHKTQTIQITFASFTIIALALDWLLLIRNTSRVNNV